MPEADYGVSTIWPLGGPGGWDYLALEPSGARLFLSRGDHVDVVETATGHRSAVIADTDGVHGIAFDPTLKRGYTSNGRANTVTAFELDTLRVIKEAPVSGSKPDAIVYEPRSRQLFVANGRSSTLDILDPETLAVLTTLALPGPPEFMATDGNGSVYVNIDMEHATLVAIDAHTHKLKATWPLPDCTYPTGLALDAAHHRLFSMCQNGFMQVTDSLSGRAVARVAIGAGPDAAAYDPDLGFVFSSNGRDGTLTVIHEESPDRYRVITTVQTQTSARTMALDPGTHKVYLAAARLGETPPPTAENPHPRPDIVPDSFVVLVAEPR